jgi:hypothetical protein
VSAALTSLGYKTGHEAIFNPHSAHLHFKDMEGINNDLLGESAWPAVGWLDEFPEDLPLFHLVRHPLKYINSLTQPPGYWAGAGGPYTMLKRVVMPEIPDGPEELCSLIHWLGWNELIEKRVPKERRHRLESDVGILLRQVALLFGDELTVEQVDAAISAGREIRENKHRSGEALFQADDLRGFKEFDALAKKAAQYGYDIDETIS